MTIRKPEVLTTARQKALSKRTIDEFFRILNDVFEKNGFLDENEDPDELAKRIYNCDETGINTNPSGKKVFIPKGSKSAYIEAATGGKTCYAVLFCTSASGEFLPPLILHKARNLYQTWTTDGPPKVTYSCTPNGWMHDEAFEKWVMNSFIPDVKHQKKPVILFHDGHGSHLTFNVVDAAIKANIIIICLPPHKSHAFQPLDVGVFKQLKNHWRKILIKFYD